MLGYERFSWMDLLGAKVVRRRLSISRDGVALRVRAHMSPTALPPKTVFEVPATAAPDKRNPLHVYLIVTRGRKKGMPVPISADLFLLGSEKICQLRNRKLSPKHCALVTRDKKVFVRDFHSGKPTLLNFEVITPGEEWPTHAGDILSVGKLEFMVQYREKPLSGRDLEEWAARCLDVETDRNLLDEDDYFHTPTSASEAAQAIVEKLNAQKGFIHGRLRIGIEDDVTTVRFNDTKIVDEGEIAMIKKEMCENLRRSNLRILLDLKNVRRLSSLGVNMLGEFKRWLGPRGSTIAMCRVRWEIQGMLRTLHVDGFQIFPDKRSAISSDW